MASTKAKLAGGAGLFTGGIAVGRLMRLDSQRGDYRKDWEDHALATLSELRALPKDVPDSERPYTILALGDSAAQGIGANTVQEGYVPRFAAAVQQALGREVALLNLSMSGATAESMVLTQLPQVKGLGLGTDIPIDLCVMDIGGNDVMLKTLPVESFEARMDQIYRQLPEGSLIGNIANFGVLKNAELRAADMSATMDRLAVQHGHHPVDLRAVTSAHSPVKYFTSRHAADMFHPNSASYAEWAQEYLDVWSRITGTPAAPADQAPAWQFKSERVAQSLA